MDMMERRTDYDVQKKNGVITFLRSFSTSTYPLANFIFDSSLADHPAPSTILRLEPMEHI